MFLQVMAPESSATDPGRVYEWIDRGGVVALLVMIVFVLAVGGMRGWFYWPTYVKRIEAENTELKTKITQIEARAERLSETVVEVFKRLEREK